MTCTLKQRTAALRCDATPTPSLCDRTAVRSPGSRRAHRVYLDGQESDVSKLLVETSDLVVVKPRLVISGRLRTTFIYSSIKRCIRL